VRETTVTPSPTPEGTKSATLKDPLATKPISIGCKTGTAESHAVSGKPHAWFSAFAPFEDPEILITVLVEEGGQGSDVAGPIARDILKTYFEVTQ
jgi:penicillin-binding protein 2